MSVLPTPPPSRRDDHAGMRRDAPSLPAAKRARGANSPGQLPAVLTQTAAHVEQLALRLFAFFAQPANANMRGLYRAVPEGAAGHGDAAAQLGLLTLLGIRIKPTVLSTVGQDVRLIIQNLRGVNLNSIPNRSQIFTEIERLVAAMNTETGAAPSDFSSMVADHAKLRVLLFYQMTTAYYKSGAVDIRSIRALAQVGIGGLGKQACHHSLLAEVKDDSYIQLRGRLIENIRATKDSNGQTPMDEHLILRLIHLGVPGKNIIAMFREIMTQGVSIEQAVGRLWEVNFPDKVIQESLKTELLRFMSTGTPQTPNRQVVLSAPILQTLDSLGMTNAQISMYITSPMQKLANQRFSPVETERQIDHIIHNSFKDSAINVGSLLDRSMAFYYLNNHTFEAPPYINEIDSILENEFRNFAVGALRDLSRVNTNRTPRDVTMDLSHRMEAFLQAKITSADKTLLVLPALHEHLASLYEVLSKPIANFEEATTIFLPAYERMVLLLQALTDLGGASPELGALKAAVQRVIGDCTAAYRTWKDKETRIMTELERSTSGRENRVKEIASLLVQYEQKPLQAYKKNLNDYIARLTREIDGQLPDAIKAEKKVKITGTQQTLHHLAQQEARDPAVAYRQQQSNIEATVASLKKERAHLEGELMVPRALKVLWIQGMRIFPEKPTSAHLAEMERALRQSGTVPADKPVRVEDKEKLYRHVLKALTDTVQNVLRATNVPFTNESMLQFLFPTKEEGRGIHEQLTRAIHGQAEAIRQNVQQLKSTLARDRAGYEMQLNGTRGAREFIQGLDQESLSAERVKAQHLLLTRNITLIPPEKGIVAS